MKRQMRVLTLAELLVAAVAASLVLPSGSARAGNDDQGAQIYAKGVGRHPVTAVIASGGIEAPATRFPCVNCHKADGLGAREGGLKPRDITWPALTGSPATGGRGYDEQSLARAITEGVDAQGARLGPGMPRYRMDPADLQALIAHLQLFAAPAEPGLSGEAIRVATLLPLLGPQDGTARAVERLLDLAVLDVNTRRRFNGRRIVRDSVPFDPGLPGDAARAIGELLTYNPPFAFLSNYGIGPDDPARQAIVDAGIPDIAPIVTPLDNTDRGSVWIEPSVSDQARSLVQIAAQSPTMPFAAAVAQRPLRLGVLVGDGRENEVAAAAASDEAQRVGACIVAHQSILAASEVTGFREASVDAVLVFASGEQTLQFLAAAKALDWHPVLLGRNQQLGALLRDPALQASAATFLVTSYGGIDPRSPGAYDFRRVVGELGGGHPELLRDAYVGVKLFERSLAASGPALTRARLRATISALSDFVTGVMPPLSFGQDASRRAATRVMWIDPARRRLVPLENYSPS